MTYDEALDFIYDASMKGRKKGTERIIELLRLMGDPHKKTKYVHVAGTNGKGSTSAMIEKILRESGLKTGLYTSPYLLRFNERIRVNGKEISDEDLIRYTEEVVKLADKMEERPSFFEIATAIGFRAFADAGCDIVVLEVGMGGRLDATNVVDSPEVSVITTIDLDHTAELGSTKARIAWEKAGIIKKNRPVVVGTNDEEALKSIYLKARDESAPVWRPHFQAQFIGIENNRQKFSYRGKEYEMGLLGRHQLMNAVTAIETIEVLRLQGYSISDDDVRNGIAKTVWKGRFQPVYGYNIVVDGAHNPEGSRSAADALRDYSEKKPVIVYGCLADKDWKNMLNIISECGAEFFTVPVDNPRAIDPHETCAYLIENGIASRVCDSVEEGIRLAQKRAEELDTFVFCAGSLYLATEILTVLGDRNDQI